MITILDSIMGSGKTTWAINQMVGKDNYIYITPLLDEVDRISKACNFVSPERKSLDIGKLENLKYLIENEKSIASTHKLFTMFDKECKTLIKDNGYTLVLDEVIDPVSLYLGKSDGDVVRLLDESIELQDDGFCKWKNEFYFGTDDREIKRLCENKSIYMYNKQLIWKYDPEIFDCFSEIYILTYMFEASIMKYYFEMHNIAYEVKSIAQGKIVDYYVPDRSYLKPLIDIYDGKLMNNFEQKTRSLSVTWYNNKDNREEIKQIKNNARTYMERIACVKGEDVMWTCFKSDYNKLKVRGYSCFVECNCRATNDYGDKSVLVYTVNRFYNTVLYNYFIEKGIKVDQDKFALSEMIQWIWRSRIRNGQPIKIYIPSKRMRQLLIDWIDNKEI